jgi:hypothetical protein
MLELKKQKLLAIKDQELERVDIFKEVEVFRAGTFKFEKNKDYIQNEAEIEKKLRAEYDIDHLKEKVYINDELYFKQRK